MLKMAEFYLLKDDTYTDALLSRLQEEYATDEVVEDGRCYEVSIQDIKFRCAYIDEEMRGIIRTSVKIINELIDINSSGYTKEKFDGHVAQDEESEDSLKHFKEALDKCNDFATERLDMLIAEMARYTRVGGAWFMLMAAPAFRSVIYAVFERMLEDYDDEDVWFSCLWFLIRGAMRMHSDQI